MVRIIEASRTGRWMGGFIGASNSASIDDVSPDGISYEGMQIEHSELEPDYLSPHMRPQVEKPKPVEGGFEI